MGEAWYKAAVLYALLYALGLLVSPQPMWSVCSISVAMKKGVPWMDSMMKNSVIPQFLALCRDRTEEGKIGSWLIALWRDLGWEREALWWRTREG